MSDALKDRRQRTDGRQVGHEHLYLLAILIIVVFAFIGTPFGQAIHVGSSSGSEISTNGHESEQTAKARSTARVALLVERKATPSLHLSDVSGALTPDVFALSAPLRHFALMLPNRGRSPVPQSCTAFLARAPPCALSA